MIERLHILREEQLEDLPLLESKEKNAEVNRNGGYSASVAGAYRFLGVCAILLDKNGDAFRTNLKESSVRRLELVSRFQEGDSIPESYVSILLYKDLFTALACGEKGLSRSLAEKLGNRPEIEARHDHPFDLAMGYTLKYAVLEDDPKLAEQQAVLEERCSKKADANFMGYAQVFKALLNNDSALLAEGFQNILAGHKKESKGKGVFRDTEDEVLCVWGVGLANLAVARGLEVKVDDPLLPAELVVGLK